MTAKSLQKNIFTPCHKIHFNLLEMAMTLNKGTAHVISTFEKFNTKIDQTSLNRKKSK